MGVGHPYLSIALSSRFTVDCGKRVSFGCRNWIKFQDSFSVFVPVRSRAGTKTEKVGLRTEGGGTVRQLKNRVRHLVQSYKSHGIFHFSPA
jgi:hypothetical protein